MFAAIFQREYFAGKGPVFRTLHQSGPDRILPNVVPFLSRRFVAAKEMIEESLLPVRCSYLPFPPGARQRILERLRPVGKRDLVVVVGEKKMAMIRHQHVATNPCAVLGTRESEANERFVQMRIGEYFPSLGDVGGNEIDRMPDIYSVETRQPAFHS